MKNDQKSKAIKKVAHGVSQPACSSKTLAAPPVYLTVAGVAEALHVPVATVYDWSSRNLLDPCKVRVGRRVLFIRDALDKLVQEGGLCAKKI